MYIVQFFYKIIKQTIAYNKYVLSVDRVGIVFRYGPGKQRPKGSFKLLLLEKFICSPNIDFLKY